MNKSEELCRLLGVEPKMHKIFRGGCFIYPDLTTPSNFVKLIFFKFPNFNNEYFNVLEFLNDNACEIENVDDFVTTLYNELSAEDKMIIEDLQSQAQQTEWEY